MTIQDRTPTKAVSLAQPTAAPGQVGDQPATFTVVTSSIPEVLTKRASLGDGKLHTEGGGQLVSGTAETAEVHSLSEFAQTLTHLTPAQALIYGLPETAPVQLTTEADWEKRGKPEGVIARTKEAFSWSEGPAIMMLDYDPEDGSQPLSRDELVAAMIKAVPGLAEAELLHWPSASSWIRNTTTGEWMSELRGQRIYLMVAKGSDIPRAGRVLIDRLWKAGHGHFMVSGAGSLLERSLVDGSVWQSNRMDFAAGAICEGPLVQDRGEPTLIPGRQKIVDAQKALPDLSPQEVKFVQHWKEEAKDAMKDEAASVRDAWLERQARQIAGPDADPATLEAAKEHATKALETRVLTGKFILEVKLDGRIKQVSVEDILDAPERYDGALTRDPLEPEYRGGRIVGKLFLSGARKTLHSFAHGATTYFLERNKTLIEIPSGKMHEAVEATLALLRDLAEFYDFGDDLVWVQDGKMHPLDQHSLAQKLGSHVQYWSYNAKGAQVFRDPPPELSKRLLSLGGQRRVKPLKAIITAPTLRLDGSVLDTPGYDLDTKLLYHPPANEPRYAIPMTPSLGQAKAALRRLTQPFDAFPFVDAVDRGVMLAALLTATVRANLPTAPGFGFDAPVQGSGKTLLAKSIAALAGDANPDIYPHLNGRDDEETRKRLMSFFRTGAAAMVWDNVLGDFDSAALAAALTSETFTDRVLGQSVSVTLPNKAMFLFTGNNLILKGDLVRRILVCRIDPKTDRPFARKFEVDPFIEVKTRRGELVAAGLTLLRGYLSSTCPAPEGRIASFEAWSDLIRNAVCWIASELAPGVHEDPMRAIDRAMEHDPDLERLIALLSALKQRFQDQTFSSADIYQEVASIPNRIPSGEAHQIWTALTAFGDQATKSATAIGKLMSYRKDRIAGGLVLRMTKDGHAKTNIWRVETAP
jgi:hypothetical protein